jgi:excisionase family DNA binding protein
MSDIPFRDRIFCSVDEAAEATGASRSKIYAWLRAGRIRATQLDGRKKIHIDSLLRLGQPEEAPQSEPSKGADNAT